MIKSWISVWVLVGAILFRTEIAEGTCGQCGALSGAACLSAYTFSACFNGMVSSTVLTCPGQSVCANVPNVCINSTTSTQVSDCPICGICNADLTYACINSTTFAYCFGTTTPSLLDLDSCPAGQYCSTTASPPNYCTTLASNSTCLVPSTTTTTTTTTSVPNSQETTTLAPATTTSSSPTTTAVPTAGSICQSAGQVGNYPDPSSTDCTRFAYCFMFAGSLRSQLYICPGGNVFDPTMQLCVLPTVYQCPGTVITTTSTTTTTTTTLAPSD